MDKYRPTKLEQLHYHPELSGNLQQLAKGGDIPHLLLFGPSGAGKKTRVMCFLRAIYGSAVEKVGMAGWAGGWSAIPMFLPNGGHGRLCPLPIALPVFLPMPPFGVLRPATIPAHASCCFVIQLKIEHKTFKPDPSKSKTVTINTIASNYHVEINPHDVGNDDYHVVRCLLKEIALTQQLDSSQRSFKGDHRAAHAPSNRLPNRTSKFSPPCPISPPLPRFLPSPDANIATFTSTRRHVHTVAFPAVSPQLSSSRRQTR